MVYRVSYWSADLADRRAYRVILGSAQLGSLSSQLGANAWVLFVSSITDPRIISIVGAYLAMIAVTGAYQTTVDAIGDYAPIVDIIGDVE